MKILVVTNLYPPHYLGGYELGCRDVVESLRARGHDVWVLTSTFHLGSEGGEETTVERALQFVNGPADAPHRKFHELRVLAAALRKRQPEIVYFWNQAGLAHWLPIGARWLGYRIAFFLSDTHFTSWRVGAFLARWAPSESRSPIARGLRTLFGGTFLIQGWPVIHRQSCHFASRFLQSCAERSGIEIAASTSIVAHWGVEFAQFAGVAGERWPIRRLLYVGQLIPQKGIHTAINALGILSADPAPMDLTLTIAGGSLDLAYQQQLRDQVVRLNLAARVTFTGRIPRAELASIYARHDVLVFPSEWDEPFAITPLEAIVAGLAVVGTTTGGSGELFVNRQTAMTFRAGDAADCARAIRELTADRDLHGKITQNALAVVHSRHTLATMVRSIEESLQSVPQN